MAGFDPIAYEPPSWALKGVSTRAIPTHRVPLARLPTPIHRWHLPGVPYGCEVYIKRDDLTEGPQLSGNKVRKLEFILAEAKAAGHDSIITLGGIQSNHCRATAVAASYLGLQVHLILRTSRAVVDQDPGLIGNLLVERLIGAQIHLVTKEEYSRVGQAALGASLVDLLRSQGKNPYLIPVGGSSALGTWGYLQMMEELKIQVQEESLEFTDVAMACGSGGTTAGVALGNHLSGLNLRVSAYMVCDDEGYFVEYICRLFEELGVMSDRLGGGASAETVCRSVNWIQAKGQGYALSRQEELQTVQDVALATGIVLDPVYTGKAVHAMLEEMKADPEGWKGRRVLFIHTGGLLGLYEAAPMMQPLIQSTGRVHRMAIT